MKTIDWRVIKTALLVTAALCFPAALSAQKCDTSAFTFNSSTGRYTMPGGISSVTSSSQCGCLQQQWDAIKAQIQAQHESCLQANASSPTNPNSGSTPNSSCSKNGCQGLHDALFTTMAPREQEQIYSCNQAAAKYQADQERIQLAEEQEQQQQAAQEQAAQQQRSQQLQARKQQLASIINAKQDAAQKQVAVTQQLQQRVSQQQQNDAAAQKTVQDVAADVEKILNSPAPNSSSMPAPGTADSFGLPSGDSTASSSLPTPEPGPTPAAPPPSDAATMAAASDNSPVPSPAPTPAPNSLTSADVLSASAPGASSTISSQPGSSGADPNDPAVVAKAFDPTQLFGGRTDIGTLPLDQTQAEIARRQQAYADIVSNRNQLVQDGADLKSNTDSALIGADGTMATSIVKAGVNGLNMVPGVNAAGGGLVATTYNTLTDHEVTDAIHNAIFADPVAGGGGSEAHGSVAPALTQGSADALSSITDKLVDAAKEADTTSVVNNLGYLGAATRGASTGISAAKAVNAYNQGQYVDAATNSATGVGTSVNFVGTLLDSAATKTTGDVIGSSAAIGEAAHDGYNAYAARTDIQNTYQNISAQQAAALQNTDLVLQRLQQEIQILQLHAQSLQQASPPPAVPIIIP